jgi:hypothetical protein
LKPGIDKDGLGWRFVPVEAPTIFYFSRIVERSSELTAEVYVQNANHEHVLRRRMNLLGMRAPDDLAKALDVATDAAGWPWRKIVEQAFASVVEAHREGESVKLLGGTSVAPSPPQHVTPGVLMKETANTWFGPGGTGKSTAAAGICVSHVLGAPFAGMPTERGVPLYLDWEDEEEAFERLLWELSVGQGLTESVRMHWRRMKAPLVAEIAYVSALIDRLGATLVVIDSATRAMGSAGEHGTYESTAIAFAEAIRALGKVTVLIVDHVDGMAVKEGGVAKKAYGSIHKLNFVRNAWSLTLDEEASEQTVGWTHAKVNHVRLRQPFGIRYERTTDGGLRLEPVEAMDVGPIAERQPLWRKIEAVLARVPAMSVKDIAAEVLGSSEKRDTEKIRVTLRRDLGRHFTTYSDGTWSTRERRNGAAQADDRQTSRPKLAVVDVGKEEPEDLPW